VSRLIAATQPIDQTAEGFDRRFLREREKQPYHELGGDYFDRIRAEGLKRYYVRRLQGLGLEVTLNPAPFGS
jgi:hypothetical protein